MAYFAPYVDESGFHMPTYADVRDDLIVQAKSIFGQDIYLEADSQDYQWISAVALKIYDTFLAAQLAYNNRSPSFAIGAALDGLVKINGIERNPSTYSARFSACPVVLAGTAGTTISNGIIQDISGYYWSLPSSVVIPSGGSATVTATCQTAGAIAANPGDINIITTPTYGWTSVNNLLAATIGVAVEKDSALRIRQSISTAQPSQTVLEGTKGAIAAVDGVTRFEVYENDTSEVDASGLPAHSITPVVEGGEEQAIAEAVYYKKGPGCYTNGTTEVNLTDSYGQITAIRFYRPDYVDIDAVINVKQLTGYTSQTTADIKSAVVAYLNSLAIGDDLAISSLWGAALSAMSNLAKPSFSITSLTAAKHGGAQATADIAIAFNEVVRGNSSYITINVT
ncbi:MAG TPA: hypothetical protein DCZ10_15780 [Pelotomaculum sp.]|nr:hypothetical protein [Pelotomaculum sp.]